MMDIGGRVATFFYEQAYFLGAPLKKSKKFSLFTNYIFLNARRLFPFIPKKGVSMLGFRVYAFKYKYIPELYNLIFFRSQYFFDSKNKKPIILDCGANIGFATLYFKWLYPDAEIHCFEPNPDVCNILRKNVAPLKDMHVHQAALSSKKGKLVFYTDLAHKGKLNSSAFTDFGANNSPEKIKVDAISLSDFIKNNFKNKKIDFIKFNIEGAENEVVKDLHKQNLLKNIKGMVFEYHHLQIKGDYSKLGQLLLCLEDAGFDYSLASVNFSMSRKNMPQNIFIYAYNRN
ncbi:MAG: FkbM family methyltransferase [Candidatus Nanoarchaeia archaeon]